MLLKLKFLTIFSDFYSLRQLNKNNVTQGTFNDIFLPMLLKNINNVLQVWLNMRFPENGYLTPFNWNEFKIIWKSWMAYFPTKIPKGKYLQVIYEMSTWKFPSFTVYVPLNIRSSCLNRWCILSRTYFIKEERKRNERNFEKERKKLKLGF